MIQAHRPHLLGQHDHPEGDFCAYPGCGRLRKGRWCPGHAKQAQRGRGEMRAIEGPETVPPCRLCGGADFRLVYDHNRGRLVRQCVPCRSEVQRRANAKWAEENREMKRRIDREYRARRRAGGEG